MSQILVPSRRVWTQQARIPRIDAGYDADAFVVQPGLFPVELVSGRPVTQGNVSKSSLTGSLAGLFNGSSAYQTFPRPSWINSASPYFVLVSFVPNNTTGARLLSFGTATTSFQITASGGLIGLFSGNSGSDSPKAVSPAGTIVAGKKYTVLFVFDGSAYSMYINGALSGGGTGLTDAWNSHLSTAINIGRRADGASYFNGAIDLVAFVQKSITPHIAREISENPWQLFSPRRRVAIFDMAAGGSGLAAQASGASQSSGSADAQAQVALAGVGVSLASGQTTPSVTIPLSAAGISVAGGSANGIATVSLSAAGLAQAAGQAGLSASVLLAAAGAAQAAGNTALAALLNAQAAGAGQAGGSANLTGGAPGALSASGGDVASGSAVLSVSVKLQATGSGQASGSANGTASAPGQISASGGSLSAGQATVSATVTLTASGFVQAMGAGQFAVQVPLGATGAAHAIGLARAAFDSARFAVLKVANSFITTACALESPLGKSVAGQSLITRCIRLSSNMTGETYE